MKLLHQLSTTDMFLSKADDSLQLKFALGVMQCQIEDIKVSVKEGVYQQYEAPNVPMFYYELIENDDHLRNSKFQAQSKLLFLQTICDNLFPETYFDHTKLLVPPYFVFYGATFQDIIMQLQEYWDDAWIFALIRSFTSAQPK